MKVLGDEHGVLERALVVTSIRPDAAILEGVLAAAADQGVQGLCVGDRKGPPAFVPAAGRYLGPAEQERLDFALARELPWDHYARKNLGYLVALRQGAEVVFETDDDNLLEQGFFQLEAGATEGHRPAGAGWVNVYRYFKGAGVWPRGFPLQQSAEGDPSDHVIDGSLDCPVQQVLVNGDPDVDAIYRLVIGKPVTFASRPPLLLGRGQWCPFNSQATVWRRQAMMLAYLPSYCSFRMTDIWRSFVAQRCLWELEQGVAYHAPRGRQERNAHDLMRDFAQEVPGYLHNHRIARAFEKATLVGGQDRIADNMRVLYEKLVAWGLVGREELRLLEAWFTDLANIGHAV